MKLKLSQEIKDDYNLFVDIQVGKYLKKAGKSDFDSEEELKSVIGMIANTWNKKIAPQKDKLDSLDKAAKTAWYNLVEIENFDLGIDLDEEEFIKNFDSFDARFPFLPENSFLTLIFSSPALEKSGFPFSRFKEILKGDEATEFEEDILFWAYEIARKILTAYFEEEDNRKDRLVNSALSIAMEELDEEEAAAVVKDIHRFIINELTPPEPKPKKKSKKRTKKNTKRKKSKKRR